MQALALTFEGLSVRVIMIDGVPWWVLADVCAVLEIEQATRAAERLDDDEKGVSNIHTPGGSQDMLIVSEPGLYKLLMTSRKPEAKRFDRWVRHDVLPEIRTAGCYSGSVPTLSAIGDLFDQKLEPVHRSMAELREAQSQTRLEIASVRDNVTFLTKRVDDMAPRRDFSDNTRRQFVAVVAKYYSGNCPCCRRVKIVAEHKEISGTAHADHFNGRERNGPEDGWLVCVRCNYELAHDAQYKERARPHFTVFQANRLEMFGTAKSQSPRRKKSRTNHNPRQRDLFAPDKGP